MATKPAQICQLEKDKLIDTQQGFVDTFNWAVQAIANLKGGENCEVTWPTDDTPTIDCNSGEDEGGGGGGGGTEAAVYDVIEDTQDNKDGITIQYTDDREDSFIPFPGLSSSVSAVYDVTASTQNSYAGIKIEYADGRLDSFIPFYKESNCNITFALDGTGIKLGVYYI